VEAWFASQGWTPWAFQREAWEAFAQGRSGLIQVPTGAGKTYAAFMGPLMDLGERVGWAELGGAARGGGALAGLHTLYVTPLRAVTRDIELALKRPARDLEIRAIIESRTGDTGSSVRARQRERLPQVLVTTPESLSLLLTRENARELFGGLRCVIVDEWHELLVSKRGTLLELALARLRRFAPGMRTWALSATLPNPDDALATLLGVGDGAGPEAALVRSSASREIVLEPILPAHPASLAWAGHLGLTMLGDALRVLDPAIPTIVFVNTRSQAERWFHAIAYARPEWASIMALHHGSLDREERERVEAGLKSGAVRLCVATSSLDLGVDFSPIERVVQVGSPKGIARTIQRAGRSAHRPGAACRVFCLPTHAMELVEIAATREAIANAEVEARFAHEAPLDVLAQHMVTCALGGGFVAGELFDEVRTAWSYRGLARADFDWALHLVHQGGVLSNYPQYRRVTPDESGVYRVPSARIAMTHRLNLGVITGDASLPIRLVRGRTLGSIDEGFITGLRAGQRFVFAGKVLEFVELRDCEVLVRPAKGTTNLTPIWAGTRLPISESLARGIRRTLERCEALHASRSGGSGGSEAQAATEGVPPELIAAGELIGAQRRASRVPREHELLVEVAETREGSHLFVYPFEGRLVHAGIAAVVALRLSRERSGSFAIAANDYGFEILSASAYPFAEHVGSRLFSREGLLDDIAASVNMSQLARLAFREVARIAGLVIQQAPGGGKSGRQLRASSSLVYDVLEQFDPENLLLRQARREVLDRHFEQSRLGRALDRLARAELRVARTARLSPFAFPLVVERVSTKMSSQTILERLEAMRAAWTGGGVGSEWGVGSGE
jgi:ATP-dependent Lhr-like helicase